MNIAPEEIEISDALMEAVKAIGQYTSTLVTAATMVQQEYNKLQKSESTSRYRRDPVWAKGLISSSQQVAAAVTHLVLVSDQITKGEASEENLIIAAKTVAAETAKLVAASSVKSDSKSGSHSKLVEAAKLINQATKDLQQVAMQAADLKLEKENQSNGKYKLPNN